MWRSQQVLKVHPAMAVRTVWGSRRRPRSSVQQKGEAQGSDADPEMFRRSTGNGMLPTCYAWEAKFRVEATRKRTMSFLKQFQPSNVATPDQPTLDAEEIRDRDT